METLKELSDKSKSKDRDEEQQGSDIEAVESKKTKQQRNYLLANYNSEDSAQVRFCVRNVSDSFK